MWWMRKVKPLSPGTLRTPGNERETITSRVAHHRVRPAQAAGRPPTNPAKLTLFGGGGRLARPSRRRGIPSPSTSHRPSKRIPRANYSMALLAPFPALWEARRGRALRRPCSSKSCPATRPATQASACRKVPRTGPSGNHSMYGPGTVPDAKRRITKGKAR